MSRRGWLLFAVMCLVWGVPYLLIKVAVDELQPAEVVLGRTVLGAAALLPWAVRSGALRPALAAWRPLLLFAVLEMAGPWFLLATAERDLSSSLTGLLVAVVPLAAAVAGRALGEADRLDRTRVAGLLVGLAGVAVLLGLDVRGGDLLAVGAVALTVVGYALGPLVVSRSLKDVPSQGVNAAALAATAVLFAVPAAGAYDGWPSGQVVLAVLALGLVCTALALVLFFGLIAEAGPHRALVITYVNPAVAVLLGVLLLGEPFTAGTAIGFPLVLAGSVLATRRSRPAPAQPATEPVLRRA